MTANAVTTLAGSYRTMRMLVSDGTEARIGRRGCSCLPTRVAKGGLGARRDGHKFCGDSHKFCRDGHETDKGHLWHRKDHRLATLHHQRAALCHRRATLRLSAYSVRAAEDCALPSTGSALSSGCSALPSRCSALSSGCNAVAIHLVVKSYGEIGKKMRERVSPTAALGNEKSVSTLPVGFVYTLLLLTTLMVVCCLLLCYIRAVVSPLVV